MDRIKFERRDGPRVFLDTRDLINVIERQTPLGAEELANELSRHNGRIVLAFTNVAELVPQTETQEPDRGRVKAICDAIESIPHAYFRIADVPHLELRAAVEAFEANRPIKPADPYVTYFWETFWPLALPLARKVERTPDRLNLLCRWSLFQQVNGLLLNRESLRFDSASGASLSEAVEDDRKRLKTARGWKKSFAAGVKSQFIRFRWSAPSGGIDEFCDFVWSERTACPGWRLAHDVYEEFRANLTARAKKNDIPDFTHLHVLPYVTHATLDRAWRTRCEQAARRASQTSAPADAYTRIFPNLDAILAAL